jgi:hypothetical protein
MVDKYKSFLLEGSFNTDGDFHLDLEENQFKENGFDKYFDICERSTYHFAMLTSDIYKVRDFLDNLIVIYRVCMSHSWLVKDLYDMTEKIKNVVFDENVAQHFECISGNYDGTWIGLYKE